MYIKLFTVTGGAVTPTEHCYTISWLKDIMKNYPKEYCKIYSYLQYMSSWCVDDNPYLSMKEEDRQDTIIHDLKLTVDVENEDIQLALENCQKLFELPAYRAWKAMKVGLQKIADFVETKGISAGKDGTGPFIMSSIKELPVLNKAFNEAYAQYMEEAKITIRGDKYISLV